MNDREWLENIRTISNEEIIEKLEFCGHDGYYNSIYYAIIEELKRRLNRNN